MIFAGTMTTNEIAGAISKSERTVKRMIHATKDQALIKKLSDAWETKRQPTFTPEEVKKILRMKKIPKRMTRHEEIGRMIKNIEYQLESIKKIYAEEDAIIQCTGKEQ